LPNSHGFPTGQVDAYPVTNDTPSGGQGQPVDGYTCGAMDETFHIHAHVSIFLDGVQLAIPASLGTVAQPDNTVCHYSLHSHDSTGKIHIESVTQINATLGQYFDIWGESLSSTDVLGATGKPIVAYYTDDGTTLNQWTGDPHEIPLLSHRQITIVIGTPISEIPTYTWSGT
jgi:hypothetical protein